MKIFTINPGSTSTKIALFEDIKEIFSTTLRHGVEELAPFATIIDQYDFRKDIILNTLKKENVDIADIDAIVGRGGLLKPIPGGVYPVNDAMIKDLKAGMMGEHASNIGGILAKEIAAEVEKLNGKATPSYIVDPVVVDELEDVARFSGHPELPRISIFHALNQKAVARRYAREMDKRYDELNLIVVHLGGGISIGAHKAGKIVDVNNALNGDGPFSPERTGSLPAYQLAEMCFSGKYSLPEVKKLICGKGGFVAYLDTNDAYEVEKAHVAGDEKATALFQAMAYQVSKEVGSAAAVLSGKVDAIILTGGIAYAKMFCEWVEEKVGFIAPMKVYPGEDEMLALAENVFYASKGEQQIKTYV